MKWDVHFDLPQHFHDALFLTRLFFASQCLVNWGGGGGGGGGGGMLSFIKSSLMIICSDSSSFYSLVFPTDLAIGCSISLPLLKS